MENGKRKIENGKWLTMTWSRNVWSLLQWQVLAFGQGQFQWPFISLPPKRLPWDVCLLNGFPLTLLWIAWQWFQLTHVLLMAKYINIYNTVNNWQSQGQSKSRPSHLQLLLLHSQQLLCLSLLQTESKPHNYLQKGLGLCPFFREDNPRCCCKLLLRVAALAVTVLAIVLGPCC